MKLNSEAVRANMTRNALAKNKRGVAVGKVYPDGADYDGTCLDYEKRGDDVKKKAQ